MAAATIDSASSEVRARRDALLDQLRHYPGLTASQLQRVTRRTPGTISGDLRALEAQSLLTSRRQLLDAGGVRRVVSVWFPAGGETDLGPGALKKNRDYAARCTYRSQAAPGTGPLTGAACTGMDPELFFPAWAEEEAAAVAVCARCPVRDLCRARAEARGERYGVWGGRNFERGKRQLPARPTAPKSAPEIPLRTLHPLDKAMRFAALRAECGTLRGTARAAGVDPATVRFYLELLELDDATQARVRSGRLTASDAVRAVRSARRERKAAS